MRIARVETEDGIRTVIAVGESFLDLGEIIGVPLEEQGKSFFSVVLKNLEKIRNFIADGHYSGITDHVPTSYLVPMPYINQIRDFYSFEGHVKTARSLRGLDMVPEWYEFPAYYYSGNSSIYASDHDLPYPRFSSELDFELEVGAIIGKEGKNITVADAWSHIFGFTLMNDWSARDQQRKERSIGLGPSKSKDFATTFGFQMVTADELKKKLNPEGRINEEVWATVNGKEYSRGNLLDMHWTFPDIISWASVGATLKPGDVIMSGTVGNGCILEQSNRGIPYLNPGDVVEFHSESIGSLKSEIVG